MLRIHQNLTDRADHGRSHVESIARQAQGALDPTGEIVWGNANRRLDYLRHSSDASIGA